MYRCEHCGKHVITTPHTAFCDDCRPIVMAEFNRERRTLALCFAAICDKHGDHAAAERMRRFAELHYR